MNGISRIEDALRAVLAKKDDWKPRRLDLHAFASESGQCLRSVGFRLSGPAVVDQLQYSTQTLLAFHVGRILHEAVEEALLRSKLGAQREVTWDHGLVSGRADATYQTPSGVKIVVEIKTMNPNTFNRAVSDGGPTRENSLQAALSTVALQATHQHLIYINKAAKPGEDPVAEWVYPADHAGARAEFERLGQAVKLVKAGFLPEREYQGAEIDPRYTKWPCSYCSFREKCLKLGSGPIPLKDAE